MIWKMYKENNRQVRHMQVYSYIYVNINVFFYILVYT